MHPYRHPKFLENLNKKFTPEQIANLTEDELETQYLSWEKVYFDTDY